MASLMKGRSFEKVALAALPVAFLLHVLEEWFVGPGLVAWVHDVFGSSLSPVRLFAMNCAAVFLTSFVAFVSLKTPHLSWTSVIVATALIFNAIFHAIATCWFSVYSPGTVTGAVLFVPIGVVVLFYGNRVLSKGEFMGSVLAGICIHTFVLVGALGVGSN